MTARLLTLILSVPALMGCHTYAPVGTDGIVPGEMLRARLRPEAERELASSALVGPERFLEGELIEREDGKFTFSVVTALRQEGFFSENLHERVRVDVSDLLVLERRELDRARTYSLLGVAAVAVTAAVFQVFTGKTGGNTIDRTDPGPSATLVDLFHLRW